MTVKDDIRQALYDAIDWRNSLADANATGDGTTRIDCLSQVARYRRILASRYSEHFTPNEVRVMRSPPRNSARK